MTNQDMELPGVPRTPTLDNPKMNAPKARDSNCTLPFDSVRLPAGFSLAAEAANVEHFEALDPESDERDDLIGYHPGHLLVFPTIAARDAACHTKPNQPIWLQPLQLHEVVGDVRQYAIGPGLGQDGFNEVAGWLLSLRFQELREELGEGASFDLSERIWIAGAAYTVMVKRDESFVEVFGDRAFSRLSDEELLATGKWLLARCKVDLAAWGLTPS